VTSSLLSGWGSSRASQEQTAESQRKSYPHTPGGRRATRAWAKRGRWSEDGIMRMAVKQNGEYKDFAIVSYQGE